MTASTRVLSEAFAGKIGGRRVLAALFTTFTFDPAFFELEILPLLFEGRISGGFSPNEKMRRVQLEECLREVAGIDVFYDRGGLVANAQSATLDFRRIDVSRPSGVFHPKLVFVLLENPPTEGDETTKSLIAGALSANLTRSGWWENLEAGHFEEVEQAHKHNWRCTFRQDLLDALDLIRRVPQPKCDSGALAKIRHFLEKDAPQHGIRNAHTKGRYYTRLYSGTRPSESGSEDPRTQQSLPEWLRDRQLHRRDWNLEIVSPYFDAQNATALKTLLTRLARGKRPKVRILLPTEPDGTASVTAEQYAAVERLGAKWSRLSPAITRSDGTGKAEGAAPRTVHAKVYRFWRQGECDVSLVGSPNLTSAGHTSRNNLEAAFLVNTPGGADQTAWWLKPLDEAHKRFKETADAEEGDAEQVGLPLSLRYDWGRHSLEYWLDKDHDGKLRIETIAGSELRTLNRPRCTTEWTDCGGTAADQVKALLQSTSLVKAQTRTARGEHHWRVLIREEGMPHKPSLLDRLTAEEILEYWSLLSEAQRQEFLASRLETDEVLPGMATNSQRSTPRSQRTTFDRFAGVFHAFGRLSAWLDEQLAEEHRKAAAIRLFGEKHDSLPVLLRKMKEREEDDAVMAYVTFLSARQIAERVKEHDPDFWNDHQADRRQLEEELEKIPGLREELRLADGDRDFLNWYEEMFLTEASSLQAAYGKTNSEPGT